MNINLDKEKIKVFLSLIGSYAGAGVFFLYFDISAARENFLIYGVLMFGIFLSIRKMAEIRDRRVYFLSAVYSLLLGGSAVFGKSLRDDLELGGMDILTWLAVSMLLFFIVPNILKAVLAYSDRISGSKTKNFNIKGWGIRALIIFVCWLPYFLSFYPGNGSSDSHDVVMQALGDAVLNNHHPVMFTLFVRLCLKAGIFFGGIETGVAFFSIAQMLILALSFSACVEWMKSIGVSRWIRWIASGFWALNPIIAMYSFTMWKDVLFAVWILLFVVCLYDGVHRGASYMAGWKNLIKLGVLSFLISFGRNNGIYVVICVLAVLVIVYRKYWKRILPFTLAVTAVILAIQGPGYDLLGINKSGFAESAAIPLQQIGHTVATDGKMTEEQEEFIDQIIPLDTIKEVYDPHSVDTIKFNKNFNGEYLEKNKMGFLSVWAQMLPGNLRGYIEAYGLQTLGYWYMGVAESKCSFGVDYTEDYGLEDTNIVKNLTGLDSGEAIQAVTMVAGALPFMRVAAPVWMVLFYIIILILQKRKSYIISVLPLLGVWGTLLIAAPVYCEFRYMFALHLSLPLLMAFLLRKEKSDGTQECAVSGTEAAKGSNDSVRKIVTLAAAAVLAIIGCKYVSLDIGSAAVVPICFLTYCFYILLRRIHLKTRKKETVASLILSVLWSAAVIVGRKIDIANKVFASDFELFDIIRIAAFCLIAFPAFFNCLDMLLRSEVRNEEQVSFNKKRWGTAALLMALCWSPYFLSYFPGNLSADSYSSIAQAIGGEMLNNHHPVLFTALVAGCLKIGGLFGSLETGIAIFSILQMSVLALTLSRCLEWMREKRMPVMLRLGAFLFFAFSPLIAMYSVTMWKDILFSCWVLLLSMLMFDIVEDETHTRIKDGKVLAKLVLLCVLTAFGRNNGIYIVAAVLLTLLIYYRKMWKKLGCLSLAVIAAIVLIQGPGYDALGIQKGEFAESVGIPLQQISYTVKYGGNITDAQKEFLGKIMPLDTMKEAYDPMSSNEVKFHEDFNNEFLNENKAEFLKVWAEILIKNPGDYIKAYCMQTMGFWQLSPAGYVYAYGADDYWIDVKETNVIKEIFGIDLAYMIEHRLTVLCSSLPFVNLFFSPAFPVWLILGCVAVLIVKRRGRFILPLIPLIALWGTIMIAVPIFGEFRYVFCLNLAIPFITTTILCGKQKKETKMIGKEYDLWRK